MAKTKEQKNKILKETEERLAKMKALVFSDYSGLKVKEMEELRNILKSRGGEYLVVKKTILNIALKKSGLENIEAEKSLGGLGLAFGFKDEVMPAKTLVEISKKYKALEVGGGILEKSFINREKVLELASLPSKIELIAKVVGTIKAPLSGLVNVLGGNLRKFVNVLNAIRESR